MARPRGAVEGRNRGSGKDPTSAPMVRCRTVDLPERGSTYVHEVDGPPGAPLVLLLHGWCASAALNWSSVLLPLSERFHVAAMDLRGHGRGIRCTGGFGLADCAEDAAALVTALGRDSAILVGYSMGGPVAQLAWRHHPDRVRGLVLCATAGSFPNAPLGRAALALTYGVAGAIPPLLRMPVRLGVRYVVGALNGGTLLEELSGGDVATILAAGEELARFVSLPWLRRVDVPTSVVVTTGDHLVPPARQRALAAAIPGARVFELPGNHFACVMRRRQFTATLTEACVSVATRAARRRPRTPVGAAEAEVSLRGVVTRRRSSPMAPGG